MTTRSRCPGAWLGRWFLGAVVLGLLGCSGSSPSPSPEPRAHREQKEEEQPSSRKAHGRTQKVVLAKTTAATSPAQVDSVTPKEEQRLHQLFTTATRGADNPPPECNRPPDLTITNKRVYELYQRVLAQWNTIRFVDKNGQRLDYTATLDTEFGKIVIALRPDLAPNHVRNFIALARAGYYDGLLFDRILHHQDQDNPGVRLDLIEAGDPLGRGDPGDGHIGYWLKPEFPESGTDASHVAGTVGACRGIEADTAGCRFYINLHEAPFLDGNYTVFGKVVEGLDVARTISTQPVVIEGNESEEYARPEKPVVIRKVTIDRKPGTP